MSEDDFEDDGFYASEEDEEHGTKSYVVSDKHFLFWPCKCGHYYGRHANGIMNWPNAEQCFDCDCKKFEGEKPWEEWKKG